MKNVPISHIKELVSHADEKELESLRLSLAGDSRKGVAQILSSAQARIDRAKAEAARVEEMYKYERALCGDDALILGLDEVGRGPIAGPLAVGATVLDKNFVIEGINDSKQLSENKREELAAIIEKRAIASDVVFIEPSEIDEIGIAASLKKAFKTAIDLVDDKVGPLDSILLDGNPLYLDPRETNVVKGDSKCASIAAASIIAKVARDQRMREYENSFPGYGFSKNKGYGTADHISAIKESGLSVIHRKSFCSGIVQETLF